MKIVYVPLDERPCNAAYVSKLFQSDAVQVHVCGPLGHKKTPADLEALKADLLQACDGAYGLVISLDMLVYGGLIPSRIHHEKQEVLVKRLEVLKEIRREHPDLVIYGFSCIMRCPSYNSDDEEPDYYAKYGQAIHDAGELVHKGRISGVPSKMLKDALEKIDPADLDDYVMRRQTNRYVNVEVLQYVRDGILDRVVIPQDDSSTYGYAAMDQETVRNKIAQYHVEDRVMMYPGADEVGMTLFACMLNHYEQACPKVYVQYANEASKTLIPLYEGASLSSTIANHILSCGCRQTYSYEMADIILMIDAPSEHMEEAAAQPSKAVGYIAERNLSGLLSFAKTMLKEGKIVIFADDGYANGSDLRLLQYLNDYGLLMKIHGYAGWNTNANTLGTALAMGVAYFNTKKRNDDFLALRYVEDGGYCAYVRGAVEKKLQPPNDYFSIAFQKEKVLSMIRDELEQFVKTYLPSIASRVVIDKVESPWTRMFEVGLDVQYLNAQQKEAQYKEGQCEHEQYENVAEG